MLAPVGRRRQSLYPVTDQPLAYHIADKHLAPALMELAGKRALITGGTRGIGAAIALDLAAGGADVVINGREPGDAAQEVIRQIEAHGRACHLITADLSKG